MLNFKIPNIKMGYDEISNITLRNHAFDEVLYQDDSSVLTVLIGVSDETYKYLKSLTKEEYKNEKKHFGEKIREEIIKYLKLEEQEIILIDVTTPLTYERYTNAYHGSYMSFLTTKKVKGLMKVGLIKGLDNFVLAGQWIMPPGGLPIALFSGKYAIRRICKMEKRKFNELDFSK
jgi:phytoene dehydrogenase-like protein